MYSSQGLLESVCELRKKLISIEPMRSRSGRVSAVVCLDIISKELLAKSARDYEGQGKQYDSPGAGYASNLGLGVSPALEFLG